MYGQFVRETEGTIDKKKSWFWLKQGDLKKGTEALVMAALEQAIRTNYIKHNIDKTRDLPGKKEKQLTTSYVIAATFHKKNIRDFMTM